MLPERIEPNSPIETRPPMDQLMMLYDVLAADEGRPMRDLSVDNARYVARLFTKALPGVMTNVTDFNHGLAVLREPFEQRTPGQKQAIHTLNYMAETLLQKDLAEWQKTGQGILGQTEYDALSYHLLRAHTDGQLADDGITSIDQKKAERFRNNLLPLIQTRVKRAVPPGIDPAIAAQQAAEQARRLAEEQARMQGLNPEDVTGYGGSSSFQKSEDVERKKEIEQYGAPLIVSALLTMMRDPRAAHLEQYLTTTAKRFVEAEKVWGGLIDAVSKFTAFSREMLSSAIGKVEHTLGMIDRAHIKTHDIEKMMKARYEIELNIPGKEQPVQTSVSLADFMDKMESEEVIEIINVENTPQQFKLKELIMNNAESYRLQAKEYIILKIIQEKTGLSFDEIRSMNGSNLFRPIGDFEDNNGKGAYGQRKVKNVNVQNYDEFKFLMDGLTIAAETTHMLMGREATLDPLIRGWWSYTKRSVLNRMRYDEMYNIGLAGARKLSYSKYCSFFGTNLDKMHPLLLGRGFDIKDGLSGLSTSERETRLKERKTQLDWILKTYNLKDQYKIAEDIVAGTAFELNENEDAKDILRGYSDETVYRDKQGRVFDLSTPAKRKEFILKFGYYITEFIDPVTGSHYELKTPRQKLDFLRQFKETIGDMATREVSLQKFNGMKQILGPEFEELWRGVDFSRLIQTAMKTHGRSAADIQQVLANPDRYQGVNGLELVVQHGGFNILSYDNPVNTTTDFEKWWRYLAGVEATMPMFQAMFNAFNASSVETHFSDDEIRAKVAQAANEVNANLHKIPGFAHMDHDDHMDLMEAMIKGLIEMTAPQKGPVHRNVVEVSRDGEGNVFKLNLRDGSHADEQLLNWLGYTKTSNGEIIAGLHGVYETYLDRSGKNAPTSREQFGSRMITRRAYLSILDSLKDSGLLTAGATERLRHTYDMHFYGLDQKTKEKVSSGFWTVVEGVFQATIGKAK